MTGRLTALVVLRATSAVVVEGDGRGLGVAGQATWLLSVKGRDLTDAALTFRVNGTRCVVQSMRASPGRRW